MNTSPHISAAPPSLSASPPQRAPASSSPQTTQKTEKTGHSKLILVSVSVGRRPSVAVAAVAVRRRHVARHTSQVPPVRQSVVVRVVRSEPRVRVRNQGHGICLRKHLQLLLSLRKQACTQNNKERLKSRQAEWICRKQRQNTSHSSPRRSAERSTSCISGSPGSAAHKPSTRIAPPCSLCVSEPPHSPPTTSPPPPPNQIHGCKPSRENHRENQQKSNRAQGDKHSGHSISAAVSARRWGQ